MRRSFSNTVQFSFSHIYKAKDRTQWRENEKKNENNDDDDDDDSNNNRSDDRERESSKKAK